MDTELAHAVDVMMAQNKDNLHFPFLRGGVF